MSVVSFKCPNCGGELIFDPASGAYKCEYCMSAFSQAQLDEMESAQKDKSQEAGEERAFGQSASENETKQDTEERAVVYHCPSCGAEIVTDETTAATFCYYCHNPVVLQGRVSGEFLPDKIIPFAIDRKEAEDAFFKFVHSKKFVPKAFFKKSQVEKLSGVYFPYWVVDGVVHGELDTQGNRVRVWVAGDIEYTETSVYRIERSGDVQVTDLANNALSKANAILMRGILPYDMSRVKPFSMGYLSGFLAEKRDMEKRDLENQVHQDLENGTKELLRRSVQGYTMVQPGNCSVHTKEEDWSYVLLPVWTVTYKGSDGKMYYYSMNGQNGKVFGELPVDKRKRLLLGLIVGIIVFLICLLIGYLV